MCSVAKALSRPRRLLATAALVLLGFGSSAQAAADVRVSDLAKSSDVFFLLIGGVMILAMHGGFAFLEVGSVRRKNQVNALNKII